MSRRDRRARDAAPAAPSLSPAQEARFGAMTPAERLRDAEYQRWVRSHRGHESLAAQGRATAAKRGHDALSAAGRLGWEATVRKYGEDYAFDRAAATRKARPSDLERAIIDLLAALGQRDSYDYEREHKVAPRTYADFCWPAQRRIVEGFGPPHFPGFQPDGDYTPKDAARIARLENAGWHVTVLTTTDLRPEHRAATRERLRAFLGLDEARTGAAALEPLVTASKAVVEGWRTMKARRDTWRLATT